MNVNIQFKKDIIALVFSSVSLFCSLTSIYSQVADSTDVGIVEVVLPESNCFCNISEVVHIKISNFGYLPASNFQLEYSFVFNFSVIVTELYVGTLNPGDTIDYYFNQPTGLSSYGNAPFNFSCSINYIYDNNQANNNVSYQILSPEFLMGYIYPNTGPVFSSLFNSFHHEYYIFEVSEDFEEVCISLCGSSFDTQLAIYKCTQYNYLFYNDDYCGLQSQITMVDLSAGRYYAEVYGYSSEYGQYTIEYTTRIRQTIDLPQDWSIMSAYVKPDSLDMNSVFNSQINQVSIVKDGNGNVFWPQYNVNLIGDFSNLEGYQIKCNNSINLDMVGVPVNPDTCLIEIPTGWSLIPYLNDENDSITTMLQSINNSIIIVKDGQGDVYWPQFNLNMIELMNPGEGYQVKSANSDTLIYPTF